MRVELQPAYVLHTRHFRDSSLIVEFLTAEFGRVTGVLKGVRGSGKAAKQRKGLTQPFVGVTISWSGRSDLKTITLIEASAAPIYLTGHRLFSGMYVNELLTRLLQPYDQHTQIYTLYQWILNRLSEDSLVDVVLRQFELHLLDCLGYGLELRTDSSSGEAIESDKHYYFHPQQGFSLLTEEAQRLNNSAVVFRGRDILSIANGDYNEASRKTAKRLCRQALHMLLGDKPLKSRELFQ